MCTYQTTTLRLRGSGKGPTGWFSVSDAAVYFDHPVHAHAAHTLNIDLRGPEQGPAARVAMELDATSARELAEAILETLAAAPPSLLREEAAAEAILQAGRGPGERGPRTPALAKGSASI